MDEEPREPERGEPERFVAVSEYYRKLRDGETPADKSLRRDGIVRVVDLGSAR